MNNTRNIFKNIVGKNNAYNAILFCIILIYAFFLFYRLGNTIFNADEHFWFQRSQNFTNALIKRDFKNTYQNPKPGVTVMFLSGVALELFLSGYEKIFHFRPEIYSYETFHLVSFATKAPLVILNIVLVFLFAKNLEQRMDKKTITIALFFLTINPYFIGISRYFHGDGTLTVFMMMSAVALIGTNTLNKKKIAVSGFFAGLAILTKLQAVYLIPFSILILLLEFASKNITLKEFISYSFIWIGVFMATFYLLFPALWVNPIEVLEKMYREAFLITTEGMNSKVYYNPYVKAIPKIFTLPSIITFFLGVIYGIKRKEKVLLYSLIFIVFYVIQIQLVAQKSERYLLPLFPFIAIVCSYGTKLIEQKISKRNYLVIMSLLVIYNGGWLVWNTPYYTAHAEMAPWGAVYVEAANYLNKKENSTELKVIAVEKPHTFRPFFKGKTYGKDEKLPNNWTPEYIITASPGYLPPEYSYCTLEKEIIFRRKVYWKIYTCKDTVVEHPSDKNN